MSQRQLAQGSEDDIVRHAIKLNVFHTINFMLQHPGPSRLILAYTSLNAPVQRVRANRPFQVKSGELEIQGGIYDLGSGRVQLLGRHKLYVRVSPPTNCHPQTLPRSFLPAMSSFSLDSLRFLGPSPAQAKLLQSPAAAAPSLKHKFRGA